MVAAVPRDPVTIRCDAKYDPTAGGGGARGTPG